MADSLTDIVLLKSANDICISSKEFNNMSDYEVKEILPNLKILARSFPQDKTKSNLIVELLYKNENRVPYILHKAFFCLIPKTVSL